MPIFNPPPTIDVSITSNTAGTPALVSAGTLLLAGGNNITLSQSSNNITIVGGAGGGGGIDASIGGNTSGTSTLVSSGTLILAGGNNITLSQNGQSITISGPNTAAQTNQTIGFFGESNTSLTSSGTLDARSLYVAADGLASVGFSSSSIFISVTQTVQTQNLIDLQIAGNTTGTTALISSGTGTLAGGNNITLSQNGNAITISGPNTAAQSNQTIGFFAESNTSLTSSGTLDARSLYIAGDGVASVGFSSSSIFISVPGGGPDLVIGGNTTGTTASVSSGTLTLAGGNNITLSQNGNAITISQQDPVLSQFFWPQDWAFGNFSFNVGTNSAMSIGQIILPQAVSFTEVDVPVNFTAATAANTSSAYYVHSAMAIIYSLNVATLTPIVGVSNSVTLSWQSNTASQLGSYTGGKFLSFPLATQLSQGSYFFGLFISTSSGFTSGGGNTTALNASLSLPAANGVFGTGQNKGFAYFGNSATTTSNLPLGGLASAPSATNNTYNISAVSMNGANYQQAQLACVFRDV